MSKELEIKELKEIENLSDKLARVQEKNFEKNNYYYQKNKLVNFELQMPFHFQNIKSGVGWATMAVDVILEKINWMGFYNPDTSNEESEEVTEFLNNIYRDNFFDSEQMHSQKDALITGTSFISVGKGIEENEEPEVLWIAENSSSMTVDFNRRNRTVESAFKLYPGSKDKEKDDKGVLWLPDVTIQLAKSGDKWYETSRDEHNLNMVSVIPVFNNSDSKYIHGRSEISSSLRYFIDTAQRILRDSEVNRDRLAAPIRSISGLSDIDLKGMSENGTAQINFAKGDLLYLPMNKENATPIAPTIQQLPANDPNQVMNLIQPIGRLAAKEMGVPPSYLGFDTVNPTSADAINAADTALIKRADSRVRQLKRTYKRLGAVTLAVAGRDKPEAWNEIDSVFKNTQTVTPAGSADRLSKLVAVGVYEKEYPDFQLREVGYSDSEIVEIKAMVRKNSNTNIINRLTEPEEV